MACCDPTTGMPEWKMPATEGKFITGLKLHNSMTRKVDLFVPNKGREVLWYGCGPTVYDASHMGHARTYVSVDIMQRIFSDYFGYNLKVCMNITDVEDKIIKRSVQEGITFEELSRKWENEFFKDMQLLNVRLPDVITRVSEYIPEINAMIEKIIANGYGYESLGNVYFNVEAFRSNPDHFYARMEPKSAADPEKSMEGEGDLGEKGVKKNASDFCLWKKAKEGEPFWDSPWGPGRPGWHIECSAMATEALGFPIDVHSGGIDLRFPHHDNELAQSEAFANKGQWVNYFLHTGHLNILGLKMSKSLKNFITIRTILGKFPARYIRLLCLTSSWDRDMSYNPEEVASGEKSSLFECAITDKKFVEFFRLVKSISRTAKVSNTQRWSKAETELDAFIQESRDEIHAALCNNIDTATTMKVLLSLVSKTNSYINSLPPADVRLPLVRKAARAVLKMLNIFGLTNSNPDSLEYEGAEIVDIEQLLNPTVSSSSSDVEAALAPVMDAFIKFRQGVKDQSLNALKSKDEVDFAALTKSLLNLCDSARDEDLVEAGIRLTDGAHGASWARADVAELKASLALQRAGEETKAKEKAQKEEAKRQKSLEEQQKKDSISSIEPQDFFKKAPQFEGRFASFDENGFPVVALDAGKETPISAKKIALYQKELAKHQAAHEEWKSRQ
eukprot:GDKJ01031704.1.p1 GENE.GDKJ01031704.1~~GDKJ01031704.1.p1  ORF type:complete len:674 (-),score=212.15 GDKJ01031704.1:213-2234(-)